MDLKKWGAEDPQLQILFDAFSKDLLAVFQADYLLGNLSKFPMIDEREVLREKNCSLQTAKFLFGKMQEIGMPESLFSTHLIPEIHFES